MPPTSCLSTNVPVAVPPKAFPPWGRWLAAGQTDEVYMPPTSPSVRLTVSHSTSTKPSVMVSVTVMSTTSLMPLPGTPART